MEKMVCWLASQYLSKYLTFTFSKVTLHRNPHMSCKLVSFSRVAVYYLGLKIVHGSLWNVFMAKRWNEQWQHFKHSWARFKTYWVGQVMHKYLFRILGRDLSLPLLELVSPLYMQSSLTSRSSAAAAVLFAQFILIGSPVPSRGTEK